MDSFTREFAFNASEQLFLDETLTSIADFFAGANESGGALGACLFRNFLCINVRKCYRGKVCFDTQAPSLSELFYLEPGSHHFFYGYCGSHERTYSREVQSDEFFFGIQNVSKVEKRKKLRFTSQMKDRVLCVFNYDFSSRFGKQCLQ